MTDERERRWYLMLGASLHLNRKRRGWTLYDVAAAIGTNAMTISRWERGLRRMKAYQYDLLRREGLLSE